MTSRAKRAILHSRPVRRKRGRTDHSEPSELRLNPAAVSGALNDPDPAGPGSGASGERISRLSAAILRISASLDLATVLEGGGREHPRSSTGARVQAALRNKAQAETFVLGELAIDYGLRRVSVAGRAVPLTTTEYELLRVLSAGGGRVVTTEALLRQVWGRRGSDDTDRVRTAVKKLRAKLGDDVANPTYIFDEHGVGYRFARPGRAHEAVAG